MEDATPLARLEEGDRMHQRQLLLGLGGLALGAGVGAGLMFLLDPTSGRRRRTRLRERLSHAGERGTGAVKGAVKGAAADVSQRSRELAAAVRSRLQIHGSQGASLESRVRARLARVATNPGAIAVLAEGSRVTLRGAVPPDELDDVLDEVAAVRGVREVYNLLQVQLATPVIPGQH